MNIHPQILQFAGSLVAILMITGLAWWLKLGGAPKLRDSDTVKRFAAEVEDGFIAVDALIDEQGTSAIARDDSGQLMVLKRHGNRFAGRKLARGTSHQWVDDGVEIDCGDKYFGKVLIRTAIHEPWDQALDRLG